MFYKNTTDASTTITSTLNTSIVYNSSNIAANLPVPSPKSASPKKKHRGQKYKPPFKDTSAEIKHLVVGLVPMVDTQDDICGGYNNDSAEKRHLSMPALRNASLLHKDALGVYRLKLTSQLLPYTPTTATSDANQNNTPNKSDTYVIVPYVVGKSIYEYFDSQSQYIAASVYKR